MKVKVFTLGNYRSNCYIVYKNQKALVIDPGYESNEVVDFIKSNNLNIVAIYATHGHVDHVGGIRQLKEIFNAKTYAPLKDKVWLNDSVYNQVGYPIPIDEYIGEGTQLFLDDLVFEVFETPGHSKGGTVLYNSVHNICFSGDTLFYTTIGRTDLPFSSFEEIKASIHKIYDLFPDNTKVYPGHGQATSIGFEKIYNQFVKK